MQPAPQAGELGVKAKAILAAARRCFARSGFHGASMASIAAEAGISVGHIYRYFLNKDAVVAALVEQDLQEITADIDTLAGSADEIAGRMLEHAQQMHSQARTGLWLEIMAEGARNPAIRALIENAELRVQSALREALSMGRSGGAGARFSGVGAELRLSFIGVLLRGMQVAAFVEGRPASPQLVQHLRALLSEALSAGPGDCPP